MTSHLLHDAKLPDITPEQALAVLLRGAHLQKAPKSRTPLPLEAVVQIGRDNHAYVSIQEEDLEALLGRPELSNKPPIVTSTARREQNDKVVSLEHRRAAMADQARLENRDEDYPSLTEAAKRDYRIRCAMDELRPVIELASHGKIVNLAIVMTMSDNTMSVSLPVGEFDPLLVAACAHLNKRLLEQG